MRYCVFSNSACPVLNISCIGCASDTAVTRFGPGVRSSWIIHYVISGKGWFNNKPVTAGQGFIITPNMQEHYFPDDEQPWEFLWVISDDSKMAELFALLNADKDTGIFDYAYPFAVKELSYFMIEKNNAIFNGFEMLELFLRIFKHQQKDMIAKTLGTNANTYIEAAKRYVNSNIQNPVTVSELTEFLGVTQPYLFKIFKERFCVSPKQYILEQKLKRAQALLLETDLSVTHIANSVGFQDVLSFSKCFKLKTGRSPQNYRKEMIHNP